MLEQNNGAEGAQNTAVNKPQNTWEIFKELFQEIVNRDPDRSTIPIFQLLGSQGPRALIDLMTGVAQQIPGSVMNKVILFGWPDQSSNISSLSQVTLKIPMNATDIIKAKADIANLTDVLVAEINRSPDGKINILMKPSWKPEVT